jgi:hypothetical protein
MTLAQLVETVLIRIAPTTSQNSKQVFRYEIEAMVPSAIVRLYNRLKVAGQANRLLQTTEIACNDGVVALPSTIVTSSLESGGDGHITFSDNYLNQYMPLSYEPIYENRYLKRPLPDMYYYSISTYSSGERVFIYKGDGFATVPSGTINVQVTALLLPTSANVSMLDVETTEILIDCLIELLRERNMADETPSFNPSTTPVNYRSAPSQT